MPPAGSSGSTGSLDPRLAVIVGVGQVCQRVDRGEPGLEATELLAEAFRRGEIDSGGGGLLASADSIRVVNILSWRYRNPARLVGQLIGANPGHTAYSTAGGNTPQLMVNQACTDIAAGRADVVLIGGAEAWRTRAAVRNRGEKPDWTSYVDDDVDPTETVGSDKSLSHPAELARRILLPVHLYPIFENALRAAGGRTIEEQRQRLGKLWAGFSAVAAQNPYAWIQREYTPEEITTVSPDNRMIGFPYPKLMNSNNNVDQGAGVIVCSVEKARALGVPSDRWVFVHAGAEAADTDTVSERPNLHSSPAIRAAGQAVLGDAGIGVDDLAHIDLYSCFPSAVQVAADELGLAVDDARGLTITGGLSFAGGPWNNYVSHAIATMVGRMREDAGSLGLVTANGGYLTKHALGIYSTNPPPTGAFVRTDAQAEADAGGRREVCGEWDGPVTLESFTVSHDREGQPELGILAALLPDGRRAWGLTDQSDAIAALLTEDVVGRTGHLNSEGDFSFS